MRTPERLARISRILSLRQPDLRVVLESVANPHNASAVLRTCDAAGLLQVEVVGSSEASLPLNAAITTRADKWLTVRFHPSTAEAVARLRAEGFRVAATSLGDDAVSYTEVDFTKPTAIVFGGEKDGISAEGLAQADVKVKIPMLGMAQSLNLSVSVGIILYEAVRQRRLGGYFDRPRLSAEELEASIDRWSEL
ncbi:MAG: RNA methyltransferase [Candidatus Aminicenantes bacterium]|nr:RNA methyltransferase [Candidatus Aminicenantes bacterium]